MLTTTLLSIVPLPSETTEDMLWDDIKVRLERIENHAENILDEWFHVGRDLEEIRGKNPGNVDYSRAAKRRGIMLSHQQMSAARWWFLTDQEIRDKLHIDAPDALTPGRLQQICREKYSNKARIKDSGVVAARDNKQKTKNSTKLPLPDQNTPQTATPSSPAEPVIKLPPPLSAKRLQEIAEEEHRKDIRAKREAREAAAAAKAAKDNRPRLTPSTTAVIMYGVQMWPIDEIDAAYRGRLGAYDWDQLLFATSQFIGWQALMRPTDDHGSRGTQLRARTRHLRQFIERRLEGQSRIEMLRFTEVIEKLADLYRDNPAGECRPPFDPILLTSV